MAKRLPPAATSAAFRTNARRLLSELDMDLLDSVRGDRL